MKKLNQIKHEVIFSLPNNLKIQFNNLNNPDNNDTNPAVLKLGILNTASSINSNVIPFNPLLFNDRRALTRLKQILNP